MNFYIFNFLISKLNKTYFLFTSYSILLVSIFLICYFICLQLFYLYHYLLLIIIIFMQLKIFTIISTILIFSNADMFYGLQLLSQKNGAACLDGSAPGIFINLPEPDLEPSNLTKILIHFQGIDFGWCVQQNLTSTLQNCHKYAIDQNQDWGSSNNLPTNQAILFGLLSQSNVESPGYYNWAKVIIKSCDGTGFQGYRSSPVTYKRQKLYFRGTNNTLEAFNYLNNSIKLFTKYTEIVLSGSLNGAIAAMQWSDYVKQRTQAKVSVLADAVMYRDQISQKQNTTNDYILRNRFQMLTSFVNQQIQIPSQACANYYPDDKWKCMFNEYLHPFVNVPIFFTGALYDAWSIIHVLGYTCSDLYTLSPCMPYQLQMIQQYHLNTTIFIKQLTQKKQNGAWGIACVAHDFVWGKWSNQIEYAIPMDSKNTPATTFLDWYLNKNVDHILIDEVSWPLNKNCAHKLGLRQE